VIHTNFTGTVEATYDIPLETLAEPRNIEIMRAVFHDPEALRPGRTSTAVTQDAARHFAEIAAAMRARGLDPAAVAHFLDRLVFCLFAEDIGLLPEMLFTRLVERYRRVVAAREVPPVGIDHDLIRLVATAELEESKQSTGGDNVFTMVRKIGTAKAVLAADYTAQLARNVGKVVFFAKHIDVMDAAEAHFASAGLSSVSIRGDQSPKARQEAIDGFTNDPSVSVIVCSLSAAGVGINLQAASNVVLAELSWTSAEQTQAIDRVHRIGQELPVTAWRILAAQTIDARIADLIDAKAGLAARALDGSDEQVAAEGTVQVQALIAMLTDALEQRAAAA
jgi:hypothetical protein